MAGRREIRCVGPSYHLSDRKAAVQRTVNMYLEQIEGLGEAQQLTLVSVPGLVHQIGSIFGDFRGARYVLGRLFVVFGNVLGELDEASLALTVSWTLATSNGYVGMAHNGTQLAVVDGENLYVVTLATNSFTTVVSAGWRGSDDVYELDGYGVFVDPDTDQFYISAIDDFATLDPLDFSSADSLPDNIVTHRTFKRELWLFGDVSSEIWIDSGDADFPFARYNSASIDVGIVGKRAAVIGSDAIFWVGKTTRGSAIVYMARGHQPTRVSTTAVEQALTASTDLSAAKMWSYQFEGHEFIGITAPGVETTWVYDAATQQWHEQGVLVDGVWEPAPIDQVVFFAERHYAGGGRPARNILYLIDKSSYVLGGLPAVRERTWPHLVSPSMEPISYRSLELACTTGHGGNITLEISNDGGFTWGAPLLRSLGAIGRWMERIRWHFLGSARDRVFRLRCSDEVPLTIHGATVDGG
jgi:stabilization protein